VMLITQKCGAINQSINQSIRWRGRKIGQHQEDAHRKAMIHKSKKHPYDHDE